MKFLEKDLTASTAGEQVKSAVPCTFRAHAAAIKAAATVHYVDQSGVEKTFFALTASLDPLFTVADQYDAAVIAACLVAAGYRSGRDLTALENAVKTASAAAAPLEKRDEALRKAAAACGDQDAAKHTSILAEIAKGTPALSAARDAVEKARGELSAILTADALRWISSFETRGEALTAVSKWLYGHAADRFEAIAAAADTAVRERAADFAGRMLACIDDIKGDDAFPLNEKGRRCACGGVVENAIIKTIKRPFAGGVGYKHTAVGGTRYCNVPTSSGTEVNINKVTSN